MKYKGRPADGNKYLLTAEAIARIARKNPNFKPQILTDKTGTLNAKNNSGQLSIDNGTTLIPCGEHLRRLTPLECERLQTLPDNCTAVMKPSIYLTENELQRAKLKYAGKVWASGNRMGNMKFPDRTDKKSKTVCSTVIKAARETIHVQDDKGIRILHPVECERLQTVPDGYTATISDTQRYKMLGNGWTIDVIAHILKNLPMKKPINVLSLFDGMSCGQIALGRAGIPVNEYYASEIDKSAIKVAMANYPNTIQLGSVLGVCDLVLPKIDLLIGGSPCQGFSFAGRQLNFDDPRSKLFFEFVRLKNECNPTYFLLENVKMKKESQDIITEYLGVEPIEINSSLVSAQNRKRLYWTNIPGVTQPEDRGILLKDILENGFVDRNKSYCLDASYYKGGNIQQYFNKCRRQLVFDQEPTLSGKINVGQYASEVGNRYRKLLPSECERLQTLPDNYTKHVSDTQRYRMIGNGWTVEVISHILKNIA